MTYIVSSGTLNPTILYYTILYFSFIVVRSVNQSISGLLSIAALDAGFHKHSIMIMVSSIVLAFHWLQITCLTLSWAKQRTIIQQYGDWYTGRWWVWYSEEGPGQAGASPSLLFAVQNVTAHPSTARVPTSYYSVWHYNYLCPWTG